MPAEAGAEGSLILRAAWCTVAPDEWPDRSCVVRAHWLLEGACSAFILRVGAGASLWFPEFQGFAVETRGGCGGGGGQFLGSILTLLQMRKLRSRGLVCPGREGRVGPVIPGSSGGSFRCLALEMLGGWSAPLSMWGCERDHGTRGTHELHLSLFL